MSHPLWWRTCQIVAMCFGALTLVLGKATATGSHEEFASRPAASRRMRFRVPQRPYCIDLAARQQLQIRYHAVEQAFLMRTAPARCAAA
jgi:hypothetical protein